MTLDRARLNTKLDEILQYYDELLEDLPEEKAFHQDRITRRGVEKTVELIADAIVDVSLMIISGMGYGKPDDARSALAILQKNKVLSSGVAAKMQDFVSFRNLLVHRYAKVDEKQEYASIQENHEDIPAFVKETEQFLKNG